jgi:hypothetical protein
MDSIGAIGQLQRMHAGRPRRVERIGCRTAREHACSKRVPPLRPKKRYPRPGTAGSLRNGRETVPFKCIAGGSADDMLTEFRARWLWDDREAVAQRQQHPVKPVAAEPAQPDPAAMALRPRRGALPR